MNDECALAHLESRKYEMAIRQNACKRRKTTLVALARGADLNTVQLKRMSKLANDARQFMTDARIAELAGHSSGWWSFISRGKFAKVHPTTNDLGKIEAVVLYARAGKRKSARVIEATALVLSLSAQLQRASQELIAEVLR